MTRVLLVTGSRSLALHPGAEAWARGLIRAALAGVDLLIVGDAPGPDAWAADEAARTSLSVRRRILPTCASSYGRMVFGDAMCAAYPCPRPAKLTVLALLDGTKRDAPGKRATRGTEHTAGLAERAGLTVQREVWNG